MANKKNTRLLIYFALLAAAAVICLSLCLLWQPFHVENTENPELVMTTYSSGLIGTFLNSKPDLSSAVYGLLTAVAYIAAAAAGYLLGSINFAIMTSNDLFGSDIRKYGSKNAGMTNMFRVYGKRGGIYTLIGDALKTAAAVFFGRLVGGEDLAYLAAMFCVLGHVAPARYKFKGGKGVLSSAIAILCLDPEIFLILACVFGLVLLISRYVSLASVVSAFVYPGLIIFFAQNRFGAGTPPSLVPMLFGIFVGLFVIFNHRSNLQRISERKENKIKLFKKKDSTDDTK